MDKASFGRNSPNTGLSSNVEICCYILHLLRQPSKRRCIARDYFPIYTNHNSSIGLPVSSKAELVNTIKPLLIQSFIYFKVIGKYLDTNKVL